MKRQEVITELMQLENLFSLPERYDGQAICALYYARKAVEPDVHHRIFIAGAFRGETPFDVECNVRMAEIEALKIARLGHFPVCMHAMYRFFDKQLTDEFWMEACNSVLVSCHGIYMVINWPRSAGAVAEKKLAEELGIPVYLSLDDLPKVEG